MLVTVHLHTILQKPTDHGLVSRLQIDLPEGARLVDLIEWLEMELGPEALLLAVNGRVAEPERELVDGDQVNLMPAISGGCVLSLGEKVERFKPHPCDSESNPAGSFSIRGKERNVCVHWC